MNRRLAALILTLPLAVAALAGCSSTAGGGNGDWPADITENFMTSCEDSSGGQTAYCECSLETLQENFTLDEFKEMDQNINDEKTQDVLAKIISSCQADIK